MANRVVNRPDVFPVGTTVVAVPAAFAANFNQRDGGTPPAITGSESQTVQADGTLTYTTLGPGVAYFLYALIGSAYRWLKIGNTTYVAPGRLPHPWTPAT